MTDLPGKAIHDFYFEKSKAKLFVHDSFGPKVEMPITMYFRKFSAMPLLEKKALQLCEGKILDVGAGAGSHAVYLQNKGFEVDALEISPTACKVMTDIGVSNVICDDYFKLSDKKCDTLLLLMNGIGLCGNVNGFRKFLLKASELLVDGGKIIFDSCDISYMYENIEVPERYFGEVKCRYEYKKEFTEWFSWLYLDAQKMTEIALEMGWKAQIVFEDDNDQYLAVLSKI
ncbi:class I SAM-dependent methyltransferase [uncultured Chryseobacterium sp.]|uniref:class I SAM-dependent methyltransferase n=1 Tax=uncultured Chryseobacterium sp. TaxID=259322 RepID=UPI002639BEB5|nr:class I SAM-dependent methyltransferase [uncultured Chryseobacterium sp.]